MVSHSPKPKLSAMLGTTGGNCASLLPFVFCETAHVMPICSLYVRCMSSLCNEGLRNKTELTGQGNVPRVWQVRAVKHDGAAGTDERHQMLTSSDPFISYRLVLGTENCNNWGSKKKQQKKKQPTKSEGKIRSRNFKQEKHGVRTGGR